jgi:hypothetical protein
LVLTLAAGCGGGVSFPGTLMGESAHFRLFVDPDLDATSIPPNMMGPSGLAALETDWTDKRALLKMPEGRKIDYHLLTPAHIATACGFAEFPVSEREAGCETEDLQIAAEYLPHQHELVHAYFSLLAPGTLPVPLVLEGTANAVGCNTDTGTDILYSPRWQDAVLETANDPRGDVYLEGGLLARFLIRTQGADSFVRYYRQAPKSRDPALFGANFSQYWGMSLDDVWAAIHTVALGGATVDATICPCALETLPFGGAPLDEDPVSHPYWALSLPPGGSVSLSPPDGGDLTDLKDCQGVQPDVVLTGSDAGAALVQIPADGRARYIPAPLDAAGAGDYLTDSCAATVPLALPVGFLDQGEYALEVGAVAPGDLSGTSTVYLQLQLPAAAHVLLDGQTEVCGSCAFDQAPCSSLPDGRASLAVPAGPLYLKSTLGPWAAPPPLSTHGTVKILFGQ